MNFHLKIKKEEEKILKWFENQSNKSTSIKLLILKAIEEKGYQDYIYPTPVKYEKKED